MSQQLQTGERIVWQARPSSLCARRKEGLARQTRVGVLDYKKANNELDWKFEFDLQMRRERQ